jgi:hypothetical protein
MGNEYNSDLKGNWVAYANLPSKFPNFPKFYPPALFAKFLSSDFHPYGENPHEVEIFEGSKLRLSQMLIAIIFLA